MSPGLDIAVLEAPVADGALDELAAVLADFVEGGASVSFMAPFSHAAGLKFFRKVAGSVAADETVLLAARLDHRIVGTVQLGLDTPSNQPHRADVKKMLVHCSARGRGVGAALMTAVEEEAKRRGRWLLVLDTVPGENGYRLYKRAGWTESGIIPDYAIVSRRPAVRYRLVLEATGGVIVGRHSWAMQSIEPGIARFLDAQSRI